MLHYQRIPRVTVDEACERTLIAQWPRVPKIGQNLKPFTGDGSLHPSEKLSS